MSSNLPKITVSKMIELVFEPTLRGSRFLTLHLYTAKKGYGISVDRNRIRNT